MIMGGAAPRGGALDAPRERPGYYAVFLRDLDGCNVEAVHHG